MTNSFNPDWISPPGDTIEDLLEEKEWSQADLASKINQPESFVDLIIRGVARIDNNLAEQLSINLGGSVKFWLTREANYRQILETKYGIKYCE